MQNALISMCLLPLLFLQLAASSKEACDMSNMAECDSTSLLQLTSKTHDRRLLNTRSSSMKSGEDEGDDDGSTLENKIASATGPTGDTDTSTDTSSDTSVTSSDTGSSSSMDASAIAKQAVQDVIRTQIANQLRQQLSGAITGTGALPVQQGGMVAPPPPVNVAGVACGTTTNPCQITTSTVRLIPMTTYGPTVSVPCATTSEPCMTTTLGIPVWPCLTTLPFWEAQSTTTMNPCMTTTQVDNITVWIDYSKPQIADPHDTEAGAKIDDVPGMETLGAEDNLPNLTIVILPPTDPPTGPPTQAPVYQQYYYPPTIDINAPAPGVAYAPAPGAVPCAPTVPPAAVPCATQPSAIGVVGR